VEGQYERMWRSKSMLKRTVAAADIFFKVLENNVGSRVWRVNHRGNLDFFMNHL
jgi:hypothetical protein